MPTTKRESECVLTATEELANAWSRGYQAGSSIMMKAIETARVSTRRAIITELNKLKHNTYAVRVCDHCTNWEKGIADAVLLIEKELPTQKKKGTK